MTNSKFYTIPFLKWTIRKSDFTRADIAEELNVHLSYINRVVTYTTVGHAIRLKIAEKLGYESWEDVEFAAQEAANTPEGREKLLKYWKITSIEDMDNVQRTARSKDSKITKKRKIMKSYIKNQINLKGIRIVEVAKKLDLTVSYIWSIFNYLNKGAKIRNNLAKEFGFDLWEELEEYAKQWAKDDIPENIPDSLNIEEFETYLNRLPLAEFIRVLKYEDFPTDHLSKSMLYKTLYKECKHRLLGVYHNKGK